MGDWEYTVLVLQKVADKYPWGDDFAYLLKTEPNPSDLDGNDALDYEEKTGITDTSEASQIDKTFVHDALVDLNRELSNYARAVVQVGIARTGDTDGNIYFTKATFTLGYVDEAGTFTSIASADGTPNFSTNSTDYQLCSAQAYITIPDNTIIYPANRIALKVECYGYRATTEHGKMKLCCSRGSYDSYLDFFWRYV